jgi:hypothetical protein
LKEISKKKWPKSSEENKWHYEIQVKTYRYAQIYIHIYIYFWKEKNKKIQQGPKYDSVFVKGKALALFLGYIEEIKIYAPGVK